MKKLIILGLLFLFLANFATAKQPNINTYSAYNYNPSVQTLTLEHPDPLCQFYQNCWGELADNYVQIQLNQGCKYPNLIYLDPQIYQIHFEVYECKDNLKIKIKQS